MNLVIAEAHDSHVSRASIEAIAAAQALGNPICVVVPGASVADACADVCRLEVAEVLALEHDALASYTADGYVSALAACVRTLAPDLVLLAHTYQARDYAPRLAARLGRPLVSDCTGWTSHDGARAWSRPIFQGKAQADVVVEGPAPHLISLQIGSFRADAARAATAPAPLRTAVAELSVDAIRQRPEPPFREAKQTVDLSQAERIVAVGRGIKEDKHIALVADLAAALGAEMAASRPICDAGWLPMERQVGSSGQTVAPKLYVAVGISGAIQHIVGMKGSKTIVAINKDADAPIFEIADYGIVGDLFEVVPALIAALRAPA